MGIPDPETAPGPAPPLRVVAPDAGRPRQRHLRCEPRAVAGEGPSALPIQPTPRVVEVGHLAIGPHVVTAITRRWAPGAARRCRLCAPGDCCQFEDVCTIQVGERVEFQDAVHYARRGGLPFGGVPEAGFQVEQAAGQRAALGLLRDG